MGFILVADDDAACRESIERTLSREGHVVELAADVDNAMLAIERSSFDLIVCDYRMPGQTGLDLLVRLNAWGSHIPVLMISADIDAKTEAAAKRLGVREFLMKPIRRQQLIMHVEHALHDGVKSKG